MSFLGRERCYFPKVLMSANVKSLLVKLGEFAKSRGADGYALEAGSAVELVKKLVAS